jgi:type IV pilus assembly protein PilY1
MKTKQRFARARWPLAAWVAAALTAIGYVPDVAAQSTDVAQTPLITAAPNAVKPNIMFVLDDSGSMANAYMPDDANFAAAKYGGYAAQCNGLAYNPAITYSVPVDSTGTDLAAGTYTFAPATDLSNVRTITSPAPSIALVSMLLTVPTGSYSNGSVVTIFSNDNQSLRMIGTVTGWVNGTRVVTVNVTETQGTGTLTNPRIADGDNRPYYFKYKSPGTQAPLSYTYDTNGVITSTTFYKECDSVVGSTPGSSVFDKVVVTPSTITQNYRNWFTYYGTRMQMMTTATSLAFKGISDKYRVGFSTISSTTVDGNLFLDVSDFDASQKSTWYSRLFNSPPTGWTPLRGALSKSGKYFAKRGTLANGSAQTVDPVQFSCQKNFAILTTDGYWNTGNCARGVCDPGSETATYGPQKLDGTNVGQQDAAAARPLRDGATSIIQTRTSLLQERSVQAQTATATLQSHTGHLQVRTRSNGNWSAWSDTNSCTPSSSGTRRECQYNWGAWSNASSCTASFSSGSGAWTIASGTDCQYSTSAYVNTASCTPSSPPPSSGPNYTVASATVCGSTYTSWVNTGSCTASATKQCQYTAWTAYSTVASCTATPQSASPTYTVSTARECQTTSTGGSTDSLADVAMYYYETDLRTTALGNCVLANGTDVCTNNVPPRGGDNATHQHMTTFTLGLGVNGTLGYNANYLSGASADYQAVIGGTKNWPNPASGLGAENIDDLWHAAVDGRGQYFSAGDPSVLSRSLSDTLAAIDARSGTAAAAATSTLQPIAGDNTEYVTSYTTVQWVGDVQAYQINLTNGDRSAAPLWSAQQLLDARVAGGTARNVYYMKRNAGANTGALRAFTYANLVSDSLNASFDGACSKSPALTQCATTGFDVTGANLGSNLVNWLQGAADARYRTRQHLLSDTVGGGPVFVHKPSFAYTENSYPTWAAAINATNSGAGRKGVVYVPSNGGMLHAFDGTSGQELWAYVPSMVMDRMYRLADTDYANKHEFFVNATPVVGDIWVPGSPGAWKTILVGGLGAGGRGYYALDITDPANPKALWEFNNDSLGGAGNLGLTLGNPVITKRANGTWVVMFTSGYNNVSPGDGNGRLFVVNANTGQYATEVQTYTSSGVPAGTSAAPSGLAKINGWVDSPIDNTTRQIYGGDLLGNLWRFDIDSVVAPNNAALRLAVLRAGSPAAAQPITTLPMLAQVTQGGQNYPVVYIGTGKLLGLSDLSNTSQQTIYAIKDPLTNTPLGDVHARSDMVAQTLTVNTTTGARSVTNNPVDWSTKSGWLVDLPAGGERVSVDMGLALTTLMVGTNAPNNDACTAGGASYFYLFNFESGSSQPGANGVVGTWLGNSFVVGVGAIQLGGSSGSTDGSDLNTRYRLQLGDGSTRGGDIVKPNVITPGGRRTSWRELIN